MTAHDDARSEAEVRSSGPVAGAPWPAHGTEVRPWRQSFRGGTVQDRTLQEVMVSLPPLIADRSVWCAPRLTAQMEDSLREIAALDASHGEHLGALGRILLRTESVASSKIEHVEADVDDYARALHGMKSNASAVSMAAATEALDALIHSVDDGRDLTVGAVLASHRALMVEDPTEAPYVGRWRDMQNWIGGSDHSPRNAMYVPPPAETVEAYLVDLMAFTNRGDVPVLAQAAVTHAQFESIHPFTDGNGRIGRGLVNTVLRRRGVTHRVVVPLASALVARRDRYFDALGDYRGGDPEPIIAAFTSALAIAARESRVTATRIAAFPGRWRHAVGRTRAHSATARLLEGLIEVPILSAEEAEALVGGSTSSLYPVLDRLVEAGVLRPLTARKRNQVWGAVDLLDELDDLGVRIEAAARALA